MIQLPFSKKYQLKTCQGTLLPQHMSLGEAKNLQKVNNYLDICLENESNKIITFNKCGDVLLNGEIVKFNGYDYTITCRRFNIGDKIIIMSSFPERLGVIVDYAPVTKLYLVESGHFIETVREDRLVLQDGLKVGDKVITNENCELHYHKDVHGTVTSVCERLVNVEIDDCLSIWMPKDSVSKAITIPVDEYDSMKSTLEVLSDPELMEQIRESHEDMKADRCRGIRGWRL